MTGKAQRLTETKLKGVTGGTTTRIYCFQYTIRSGDTLSGIAAKYKCTVDELMHLNESITNANSIYAGQTLLVPCGADGKPRT